VRFSNENQVPSKRPQCDCPGQRPGDRGRKARKEKTTGARTGPQGSSSFLAKGGSPIRGTGPPGGVPGKGGLMCVIWEEHVPAG